MDRRGKLVMWTLLSVVALVAAWTVWPGIMAWRTRSEAYNAAVRQCAAEKAAERFTPDKIKSYCS